MLCSLSADKLVKVTSLYEHSKSMQRIDSAKHEVEWQKTQGLVAHKTDKFKSEDQPKEHAHRMR